MRRSHTIFFAIFGLFATFPAIAQTEDDDHSSELSRRNRRSMPPARYIVGLNPIHRTDENWGVGLSAELFFKNNPVASLYLPFSVSFADEPSYRHPELRYVGATAQFMSLSATTSKAMLHFYPGVKIYPAGAFKKVSYAIGTHLAMGIGGWDRVTAHYQFDSVQNAGVTDYVLRKTHETHEDISRFKLGVLVSNSLNLRPVRHLYIGLEFGIGYSFLDLADRKHLGSELLMQGGVKFGYVN